MPRASLIVKDILANLMRRARSPRALSRCHIHAEQRMNVRWYEFIHEFIHASAYELPNLCSTCHCIHAAAFTLKHSLCTHAAAFALKHLCCSAHTAKLFRSSHVTALVQLLSRSHIHAAAFTLHLCSIAAPFTHPATLFRRSHAAILVQRLSRCSI